MDGKTSLRVFPPLEKGLPIRAKPRWIVILLVWSGSGGSNRGAVRSGRIVSIESADCDDNDEPASVNVPIEVAEEFAVLHATICNPYGMEALTVFPMEFAKFNIPWLKFMIPDPVVVRSEMGILVTKPT